MKYLAITLALAGSQAVAQNCASHDVIVEHLAKEFQETRQSVALDGVGNMVEVFASEAGTWTLTVTQPGAPTCLVMAGVAYQLVDEPLTLGEKG